MYSLLDISEKDIVTIKTGRKLGRVDDLRFDPVSATIDGFIVLGKLRFFGLFGREPDIYINYKDIMKIGSDVILVNCEPNEEEQKRLHL